MTTIDQLISTAPDKLSKMLEEARDEIAEAMLQAVNEGQENDKPAKVSVPFSIVIDLDKNAVAYSLTVTRKTRFEESQPFEDPKQTTFTDKQGRIVATVREPDNE